MTTIEDRLRRDLPDLADAQLRARASAQGSTVDPTASSTGDRGHDTEALPLLPSPRSRTQAPRWITAAAVLTIVGAIAVVAVARNDHEPEQAVASWTDDEWGTWATISDAPTQGRRAHPVVVWTGDKMIVWGGTNLERNFAATGGASYDPRSDTWQELTGPSWGHPGLVGVYFDGLLWLIAKGGGSGFAPGATNSTDLPQIAHMSLTAVVATDTDLWVLGPTGAEPDVDTDLGIARFDPVDNEWELGPSRPASEGRSFTRSEIYALMYDNPPVWTGSEIVVWDPDGHASAFDPSSRSWRHLPHLTSPTGVDLTSTFVATDTGLVALVQTNQATSSNTAIATLVDDNWTWQDVELPPIAFDQTTVVGAGEWVMLLRPDDTPIAIHPATGRSHTYDDGPLAGVEAPGAVWTGEQLLIWGGIHTPTGQVPQPPTGAAWTPPQL